MKRTTHSFTRHLYRVARRFFAGEIGAASSEYATVLAVVIIAVLASVMSFGQNVSNTVGSADNQLAALGTGGGGDAFDGGSGGNNKGGNGKGKGGNGGKGKGGKGNGGKGNGDSGKGRG